MESPNAPPAHDFFTPAWLKLPDPQFTKKSAVSPQPSETQSRRYSTSSNGSYRKESSVINSTNGLSNGSGDSRFNSTIHDSPPYLSNSRHNSFGSEQQFNKANPQSAGNVNGLRLKKTTDASPRIQFRPPYRDKSGGYHSNPKNNRNFDSFKNFNSPKKLNKFSDYNLDNEKNEENCNVFNQEFPSLVNNVNGEQSNGLNDNNKLQSAWTNPSTKCKVLSTSKNMQLIHSAVNSFDSSDGSTKSNSNGTPKSIIAPTRNVSLIGKKQIGILKENGVYSRIQPVLTKTSAQTASASMEILVKNPKKKSNKDFLKSIQNDQNKDKGLDKDVNHFGEKFGDLEISTNNRNIEELPSKTNLVLNNENDLKNARNINDLLRRPEPCDDPVLSSSLEAEHRLLMELGWKEEPDDDPSYAPLTEDEVKEFKDHYGFKQFQRKEWNLHSNQTIHLLSRPTFRDSEDLEDESTSSSDDE